MNKIKFCPKIIQMRADSHHAMTCLDIIWLEASKDNFQYNQNGHELKD